MQNRSVSIYCIVLLTILLGSCISGSGIYQSHYPNKLKQGNLKKVEHTKVLNENTTHISEQQFENQITTEFENEINNQPEFVSEVNHNSDSAIQHNSKIDERCEIQTASIDNPSLVGKKEKPNIESDGNCPKVTDLQCSYIGKKNIN